MILVLVGSRFDLFQPQPLLFPDIGIFASSFFEQ